MDTMIIEQTVFYVLAGVTLLSALGVVLLRNVLHSALLLGLSLAGVAGLFASLGSDFIFAAQILVYVTGVAVLVLFVVMLAGRKSDLHLRQVNRLWQPALLICAVTLWGMWRYIAPYRGLRADTDMQPTTGAIARLLLGDFAVPFELISVILVVALIGAVIFTRPARSEEEGA